jgi:hypothetical protein
MDRIWRDARSIGDLGGAMAGWLEGRVADRPGYTADRPDGETDHLVPVLARLNRRGYVTTDSQPGEDSTAYDGRPWVQRAAVQGYITASDPLLPRIIRAARAAGLIVTAYGAGRRVGPSRGLVVTRWGGEPHSGFGGRTHGLLRAPELLGAGRLARRELVRHGVALAVVDPVWGRDDVLWDLLNGLCDRAASFDHGMRTA